MSPTKNPPPNLKTLTQRAKTSLRTSRVQVKTMSLHEILQLIHELQVHQIELEMQNEELRRTQLNLQHAHDRYADLYDFAPVGFLSTNVRGEILEANLTACQFLAVERKTLIHQDLEAFVMPDDQPILRHYFHSVELGRSIKISDVIRMKPGHASYLVQLESFYANADTSGAEARVRLAMIDITEKEKIKQTLVDAQSISHQVFESSPDLISVVGHDYRYRQVNYAYEVAHGISQKKIVGIHIATLLGKEVFQTVVKPHYDRALAGGTVNYEAWFNFKALGQRFMAVTYAPLREGSKTVDSVVVIVRDLTDRKVADEALMKSEAQRQLAMSAAKVGTWTWNVTTNEVVWSQNVEELFGLPQGTFAGTQQAYLDLIHPSDLSVVNEAVLKTLNHNEPYDIEHRIIWPDGSTHWVACRGNIVGNQSIGKSCWLAGTVVDVTVRRQTQEALKKEQQFISAILDTAGALVVVLDPEWKIVRFNRVCEELTGRTLEDMRGRSFIDLSVISGEDGQQDVKNLLDLFKERQFPESFENAWLNHDRQLRWISWSNTAIRDQQENIEYIIATGLDSTDRKQAEQEIRRLSTQNALILNSAGEGIYGLDNQGKVTFFNQAAQRLTGWRIEDVQGKVVHPLLHHSTAEGMPHPVEECSIYSSLKDGVVHHQVPTEVFWRQDGTYFPTEYTSTPILDEGKQIKGAVVTFRDISERHRNENLLRGEQQILEMISVEKSLVEIFETICSFVEKLDRGALCSIFLYDGMTLKVGAAPSLPESYVQSLDGMLSSPDGGSCGTAAYRKKRVIVSDIQTDPLWKQFRKTAEEHGLRACWSTPILSKTDTVLGVLGIYHHQPQNPEATDLALMDLSCGLAGVAIERNLAQDALQTKQQELQALGGQLISAQEDERRRISRELHDDMNQRLAVLALDLQSAQKGLSLSSPMYQTFQKLYDEVSTLSDDVRHLAYQLHPSILDDLGLEVALRSYLNDFSKWEGIPVVFFPTNIPVSLSQDIASCLYRLTQECLRNVSRHAQATQVDVKLFEEKGGLRLSIKDNGIGFRVEDVRLGKHGLGLIGMQERVRVVRGTYEMKSVPDHGTECLVWVPIGEEKSAKGW